MGRGVTTAPRRLNLGCGAYPLPQVDGWANWDQEPTARADRYCHVPPLDLPDTSVEEIYAGHLLEHFLPTDADALLRECYRVLRPGGRLGVVVPDTRWVLEHHLLQDGTRVEVPQGVWWELDDLDAVNAVFLYSTIQDSPHQWSYNATTLRRMLERAGFQITGEIDRWRDARASSHNPWSCGWDAIKPEGDSSSESGPGGPAA